jgi:glutaredoxin
MKKCPKCQKEIDTKASKCPYCQSDLRSWFKRHPILTALLILLGIGIVGSVAGGGKKSPSSTSTDIQNETSQQEEKKEEVVAGLNTKVQDGDLAFTVLNVEKTKTLGNSFTSKDAQGMFHVVSIKIENVGKKTATFDTSMAKVTDSQGREFERSIEGGTAKGMSEGNVDLFLQQVQPGLSVTGDVVFDLPAEIQDPTILLKGGVFNSGVKVKLE